MKLILLTACATCLTTLLACATAAPQTGATSPGTSSASIFDGKRYSNPHLIDDKKNVGSYFRMRLFGDEQWADYEADAHLVAREKKNVERLQQPGSDTPTVTWIGHSTVLIQYAGITVLTDPIFSYRASPFSFAGPKRVTEPGYAIADLPSIDLIVISHNHYDHLDRKSLDQLASKTRLIGVPLGLREWVLRKTAFTETQVVEFDWWDSRQLDGFKLTATPSQHWSSRSLGDRMATLWAAWLIEIGNFKVWFGGDTGYNEYQFAEIGRRHPDIDLGLIPIGAYAPRWFMKDMHVNPIEAVRIHRDIDARQSVGIHWGTFQLTAEPIDEPPRKLIEAVKQAGLGDTVFRTLAIGETVEFGSTPSVSTGATAANQN